MTNPGSLTMGFSGVDPRHLGLVHLIQACPTKGCPKQSSPSFERIRKVIRQVISYVRRALDPNPNVLLHGARLAGEAKENANTSTHVAANKTKPLPGAGRGTADV